MKKFLLLTALLFTVPALGDTASDVAECEAKKGEAIEGTDGIIYCKSKNRMNWWSAWSWCESLGNGKRLIDLGTDFPNYQQTGIVGELNGVGSGEVWTKNVPNSSNAYYVNLSSGSVGRYARSTYDAYNDCYALCR